MTWTDVRAAIARIAELADDDFDGDGSVAITGTHIDKAYLFANVLEALQFPPAGRVVPSVNGEVIFEWYKGSVYLAINTDDRIFATLGK